MRRTILLVALVALVGCGSDKDVEPVAPVPGNDAGQDQTTDTTSEAPGVDTGPEALSEDSAAAPDQDAPGQDGSVQADQEAAAEADATQPAQQEQEPNDGTTPTEYNQFVVPGTMTGVLSVTSGTCDENNYDTDGLQVSLGAGTFWRWEFQPLTGKVAPYVDFMVLKSGLPDNDTYIHTEGAAGQKVVQDQFVLDGTLWTIGITDAASGCGPDYTWSLTGFPLTPTGTEIAGLPTTQNGTLGGAGGVSLYKLKVANEASVTVTVKAEAGGDLLPVVALFDDTHKFRVISDNTNTFAATGKDTATFDRTLSANVDYVVVVQNAAPGATSLGFTLDIK